MGSATVRLDTQQVKSLTDLLQTKLQNPATSPEFDFHGAVEQVLADVGLTARDSGGKLTFYGQDPIVPSSFRFGAMAAVGLAARSVALAALWKSRTGEGQDIHVDVRKALRRFTGFFEGKWETINGRSPLLLPRDNPFFELPLFRRTRDGRHVVSLNIYPGLQARAQFPEVQQQQRIHRQRRSAVARGGIRSGRGGGWAGLCDGAHKRGVSQRAPVHGSALQNAADHIGKNRRERAGTAQERRKEPIGGYSRIRHGARDCRSGYRQRPRLLWRRRPQHLAAQ